MMSLNTLRNQIQTELLLSDMVAGVYFEDLADGEIVSINADAVFPSASVIKVPIAIHMMKLIQEGTLDLSQTITMDMSLPEYNQPMGSGVITNLTSTLALNIRDLLMLSLAESDNLATNELLKLTSMKAINTTLSDLGLIHTRFTVPIQNFELLAQYTSNPATVYEMGLIFKKLFYKELPMSDLLMTLLGLQKYNNRIPFFMPEFDEALQIPHKTGSVGAFIHDAGLVMRSEFNYVLSVLTEHQTTWLNASLSIARISNTIYRYMVGKYPICQSQMLTNQSV
jgi:beta-lactamase class A